MFTYFVISQQSVTSNLEESDSGWVKKPLPRNKEEERLDKMLYSLDLSIRKRGRISLQDFSKVVSLVESLQYCSPTQAVLLLRCCGEVLVDEDSLTRTRLVEKILRLVKNINRKDLNISHYNTLLKVKVLVSPHNPQYLLLGPSGERESRQHLRIHGNFGFE